VKLLKRALWGLNRRNNLLTAPLVSQEPLRSFVLYDHNDIRGAICIRFAPFVLLAVRMEYVRTTVIYVRKRLGMLGARYRNSIGTGERPIVRPDCKYRGRTVSSANSYTCASRSIRKPRSHDKLHSIPDIVCRSSSPSYLPGDRH